MQAYFIVIQRGLPYPLTLDFKISKMEVIMYLSCVKVLRQADLKLENKFYWPR